MRFKALSLTLKLLCAFVVSFSVQATAHGTLPVQNIPVVKQPTKVPQLPNFPVFPPGSLPWKILKGGGVTVGGGLIVPSVCGRLHGDVFDKRQVERARSEGFDVSRIHNEFFQAMVDVAVVLKDLQERSEQGRLKEKHLTFLAVIHEKMSGVSPEIIDLLAASCSPHRPSFLLLIYSSKQLDHIQNALDYLLYFGSWEL